MTSCAGGLRIRRSRSIPPRGSSRLSAAIRKTRRARRNSHGTLGARSCRRTSRRRWSGGLNLDADLEEARREEAERFEHRHEAVSMDTSTFMAIPGAHAEHPVHPAGVRREGGAPRPLDRLLLDRDRILARCRAGPGDRRGELLRHHGTDVGVHDRLPGAEPGPLAVRGRRDPGSVRARLHRGAREGEQAGGVPARLDSDLPGHAGARGDHGALHPAGARSSRRSSRPASAARSST